MFKNQTIIESVIVSRACSLDWIGRQPPKMEICSCREPFFCDEKTLDKFMDFLEIKGINARWRREIHRILFTFLDKLKWSITEEKTIDYILDLRNNNSINSYRKKGLQIRRFLTFHQMDWASKLKFPNETHPIPIRIIKDDILEALEYFSGFNQEIHLQCTAVIHLVSSTGMRPFELYKLRESDVDFDRRVIKINKTKTGISRIAIFNHQAAKCLKDYVDFFNNGCTLDLLFSEKTVERRFRNALVKVKDLRKFFSQEWDRRGGPTSIKKILMGHSLKGDVDLMHYNARSTDDLKKIYDKVMNKSQN